MYPKTFLANFWETEQKNDLFVGMPFDDNFDRKFKIIDQVAKDLKFDRAITVKNGSIANDLLYEILDGIANSRTLLFDLTNDLRSGRINENVLYELGIATAIREPENILLIREKPGISGEEKSKHPFDIGHIRYNECAGKFQKRWLKEKLGKVVTEQKWYGSKRVKTTTQSLDIQELQIIHNFYVTLPEGDDHFNLGPSPTPIQKLTISRLLDLGMLRLGTDRQATEASYNWTPFGRAVIKNLGVEKKIAEP